MRERTWGLLVDVLLIMAILVAGLKVFGAAAAQVSFHGDEGMIIATTRYFDYLFVRRDVAHPAWGDNYWTHTHPMVGRYLIGGALWLRGYDLEEVLPPYDHTRSLAQNRHEGRVPDDELLLQARAPMVVLAAGAVAVLYAVGRLLGGVAAGVAAATLALANPFTPQYLVRAVGEAPLAFFLALGLLFGVLGARHGRDGALPTGWAIALGVALGLGIGNKLTAIISLAAVLVWGILVTAAAAARGGHGRRAWAVGRGWALAVAITLAVFVASDPHLYPNPPLHTAHLFISRAEESRDQQAWFPHAALRDPGDRAAFVFHDSLVANTLSGTLNLPLEAALAAAGAAGLLVTTWRTWRATGQLAAEGLVLLTALAYFAGLSAFIHLPLPRYLIPTLLLGALLSGLGVSALSHRLSTISLSSRGHRPAGEGDGASTVTPARSATRG